MTIKILVALLESFDDDSELVVEIAKDGDEAITTYDISFGYSEFGEFMLRVHE